MSPREIPKSIGRYEVVRRLGHGGMGIVYLGRDPRIGRQVAIKLLHMDDVRERFLQEAQSAGRLAHRNIVTIFDYGDHDGQPFIVMEFIEGTTLADHIRSRSPFPQARKLEIIEHLSSGLDYAHDEGLVHRDVKPANIMIGLDGVVKILDFGIARVTDSGLTQAGVMMGTPNYMSPEQVEGKEVDRRSDIFAVGLVLYELLAYQQAFSGETAHVVMNAIVRKPPAPLAAACPGLDPAIERIVIRALQKDPAKRYQTLAQMAVDIARARERAGVARSPTGDQPTVTMATPHPTPASRRTTPRGTNTSRDMLAKKRLERIESHLLDAQRAFDSHDYPAALECCEQAALLDPDETRVLELLERTREMLDAQKVAALVAEAEASLLRDDVAHASQLVAQALQIDTNSPEARAVEAEIIEIEARRRQAEEQQAAIASAMGRARTALSEGNLQAAIRFAGEALIHDPDHAEARELQSQGFAALEQQRQRDEHDRAARAIVNAQKREFSRGQHREAIAALEAFAPQHDLVTTALAELRGELAGAEQRKREAEERRLRDEAEAEQRRQAEERWVARQLEVARSAIDSGEFNEAIDTLEHVQRVAPGAAGLAALLEEAHAAQAAVEAEAARRRQVTEHLGRAASARAAGRLPDALSQVEAALQLSPDLPEALTERALVVAAMDALREQQAADAAAAQAVASARVKFDAGDHRAAIDQLEAYRPAHLDVSRALKDLQAKLADIERQREQAQARALLDALRGALARARAALDQDNTAAALQALDEASALDPTNAEGANLRAQVLERQDQLETIEREVARGRQALANLDLELASTIAREALAIDPKHKAARALTIDVTAAVEEARRREEEQAARRRAEAERTAREKRIADQVFAAQQELTSGNFSQAIDRLRRLVKAEGTTSEIDALLQQAIDRQVAADREARLQKEIVEVLADARRRIDEKDWDGAEKRIERVFSLEPGHAGARQAREALNTLRESHRREEEARAREESEARAAALERDIRDQMAQARAHIQQRQFKKAIKVVDAAREQLIGLSEPDALAAELDVIVAQARREQESPASASGPRSGVWKIAAAAAAVLVAAAVVWFATRTPSAPPTPPDQASVATSVATTVPPVPAPTTVAVPTVPSGDGLKPDVSSLIERVRGLVRQGNLAEAARVVAAAPPTAAADPAVANQSEELVNLATARMDTAKRAAERAGRPNKSAYDDARAHEGTANARKRESRMRPAVEEYLTAEKLFLDAARAPQIAAATSAATTIPAVGQPPTVAPTVAPSITSTASSSTPTTTTVPAASNAPAIDQATAVRLLDDYGKAARGLDLVVLQQNFPLLTIGATAKLRFDALKKTYSFCDYTFSNVKIAFSTATEASIGADVVEACKPRIAVPARPLNAVMQFTLRKTASGWTVLSVVGPS